MAKYDDDNPPGMIPIPFVCIEMYLPTYCLLLHLVLLFPGLGFVLIFLLWLSNRERSSAIDQHGKAAVNWLISCLLYAVVAFMVSLYYQPFHVALYVLIGVYYLFPIIAAIKAYDGKYWHYPLSIPFFKD